MARSSWCTWLVLLVACDSDSEVEAPDDSAVIDGAPDDTLIDSPIDMAIDAGDPCAACQATEKCVQRFDGTCNMQVECVANGPTCQNNACTQPCENAYCPQPYQCDNRPPCGTEVPGAFTCYGP